MDRRRCAGTPFDVMLLLILLGFLVSLIASMTGLGGGTFFVPILLLIFDFTSHEAVGTSLAVITFTSLASTLRYMRQRRIDYKIGLISAGLAIPGAFIGASLTVFASNKLLGIIFACFLIFAASFMFGDFRFPHSKGLRDQGCWHRILVDSEGKVFKYEANVRRGFIFSFLEGLFSGLLGTGGGPLIVPILHLAMNLPIHIAVATSMFIMIFTSTSGVLTHIYLNNVNPEYVAYLAVGWLSERRLELTSLRRSLEAVSRRSSA